jgi:sacsin
VLTALYEQVAANIALVKNLTLHGIFWGSYLQHRPAVLQKSLQELVELLADGKILVPVSHRCACIPRCFSAMNEIF